MATIDFGTPTPPPQGGGAPSAAMLANDAMIQQNHPNWPTGGTAVQFNLETGNKAGLVSPKGAKGIPQVADSTLANIEASVGRKLDPNNWKDALEIHRYIINENMKHFGEDPQAAVAGYNGGWNPNNWNNPETQQYVQNFSDATGMSPTEVSVGSSRESPQSPQGPQIDFGGSSPQSNTIDFGNTSSVWASAGQGAKSSLVPAIGGLAGAGIGVLAGGAIGGPIGAVVGGVAGGFGGGEALGEAQNWAVNKFPETAKALGLDKETQQQAQQAHPLAYTLGGFVPQLAAMRPTATLDLAGRAIGAGIGAGSTAGSELLHGQKIDWGNIAEGAAAGALLNKPWGIGAKVLPKHLGSTDEASNELNKLNTAATTPPQTPAESFGPERPPINVNAAGVAESPLQPPTMESIGAEIARQRQMAAEQQAAGDLFPQSLTDTEGQASPYNPNRISEEFIPDQVADNYKNLRQGELNLQPDTLPDRLIVSPEGETMTEGQAAVREQFGDTIAQRVADLNRQPPEQLDIFNPIDQRRFDQFGEDETPRTLNPDEFKQTVENLASKDGTRFPLPEDMERAYERYLDTTRDDQGGLFDRPTMAKNFVEAAAKEALERRINDNPAVKAALDKVTKLEALVTSTPDSMTRIGAVNSLEKARDTLQKARDNVGKLLEPSAKATLPWEKDGIVNMHTFGHMPTLMKSIAAILKGIHGVVFKMADRVLPNFRNLDSSKQIFAQGVKNFVNREANREWSQTVNEKPIQQLSKIQALRQGINEYNPYSAQGIGKEAVKAQIKAAPDIPDGVTSKIAQNVVAGGLQLTNLTRHPLIKYVTEQVDTAARASRAYVRERLTGPNGLRTKLQKMTSDELTGIWSLRMLNEGVREFSDNELRNLGYSDKQIDWYKQSVAEQKDAFIKQNEARVNADMKPMESRIGHVAGYFMGDFHRLIMDKDDHTVAVIAHNTRKGVNTLTKRFMETHGDAADLKVGDVTLNKLKEGSGAADNRFTGYMEILNTIGESNPHMQAVLDAYKDMTTRDAQLAMANRAKFKSKEGVIGAEGKKSWESAKQNALNGARQQLRYLESLDKWANMQKAVQDTRDMIADPELKAPNAQKLAQDYLDSVQGRNRGTLVNITNGLMNMVSNFTGVGPSVWKGMNNVQKNVLLLKFVGIGKLSHSAVTLIQPLQALLPLNMRLQARGADLGTASVTSVAKAASSSYNISAHELIGKPLDGFEARAHAFMQANGTTDVGMSSHLRNITASSANWERVRNIGELNVKIPEHAARQFTFMYAAHMLTDLGLPENEAFATAHNYMRDAMVDYSPHERPLMFGKMGILGDIASTLTRFKYNQIGQHLVGGADVLRGGSVAPLAATVLTSIVTGGLRGVFAYEAANQIIDKTSTLMAKLGVIKQPTSLNEMILHMLHGTNKTVSDLVNFGAPAALGVNMTGSLTNADSIPVDPLGALFPTASEFQHMAESTYNLAAHHNLQAVKQFAFEMSPNSMKGLEENAFFTKPNGDFMNPKNPQQLVSNRTTGDQVKRALSFRPLSGAREALVANVANRKTEQLNDVKSAVITKAMSDLGSSPQGQLSPSQVQEYTKRYIELGGSPESFVKDLVTAMGMEQKRNQLQRAEGIPGNDLSSVDKYLRAKGME